ncbi:MAG: cation diffusion facilitator family transporter [Terricaulis sp.]
MDDCCSGKGAELERIARQRDQRRVLIAVLTINAAMFAIEFAAGVIAGSVSLMADAVDMFGDAMVYGLTLYALDRSERWKNGAAVAKGAFILVFGVGVLLQVANKIQNGVEPSSAIMLGVGGLALVANLTCLAMLWRFRKLDLNMSSTFECSRNDVIANLGVLLAAFAVALTRSPWPDILIGMIIAALFLRSAWRVLREAWPAFQAQGH